jgi:hypothetical protein
MYRKNMSKKAIGPIIGIINVDMRTGYTCPLGEHFGLVVLQRRVAQEIACIQCARDISNISHLITTTNRVIDELLLWFSSHL